MIDPRIIRYFNFSHNWDRFYAIWSRPNIQAILKNSIDHWHTERPANMLGSYVQQWHPGDSLWQLSESNYWCAKIDKCIKNSDFFEEYILEYRRMNTTPISLNQLYDLFSTHSPIYSMAWNRCKPRYGTLESLVLINGNEYIYDTLLAVASYMLEFPIITDRATHSIFICTRTNEYEVFDLINYYRFTYDNDMSFEPVQLYSNTLNNIEVHNNYENTQNPQQI